ncbi:MAG: hypothetical protein GF335_01345 [Candidatus Moranbacteria bacterium]|nr:hypothetical protein [Candidatus Moranbacteria bacterium]
MKKTTDLKLNFLGVIPQYEFEKIKLNPQEISAFSGLLTFRGDSVEDLIKESKEKNQDIKKKIKLILRKSSLKGHASMATMPVFCFTFEGSKMIGSMLTGITFSSALMHSGRRANVSDKDNVFPSSILKNSKAKKIYQKAARLNIEVFNQLLSKGASKDEASKIVHYGTYGTGIITLPAESFATFVKETEIEKKWMPEEADLIIAKIQKNLKKMGMDLLYATRMAAPRNTYPFPNLFKNPKINNFVRDQIQKNKLKDKDVKVFGIDNYGGEGFKKRIKEFLKVQQEICNNLKRLKKDWPKLLDLRRKIVRDYANAFSIKSLSRVSWRVWRDKKRHRTAPVTTESIYYCIEKTIEITDKYIQKFNRQGDLDSKELLLIDKFFAVPKYISKNKNWRKLYLKALFSSLNAYKQLIKEGIKEADAVFVIPRGLRIEMIQEYNLHNIIDGYFPLRSCPTADEQIFTQTKEEVRQIKTILKKKNLVYLSDLIEPKCVLSGFCPEEETCGYIKKTVPQYDKKLHESMKKDLEDKFQEKLKNLKA